MSFNSFIRKKMGLPVTPRVNKGACPFCGDDVFVAEGQLYKTFKGQATHKKCRPK